MKMITEYGKPEIWQAEPQDIPEVKIKVLDNNIPVYMIEAGTEDVLRVDFTFCAGQIMETVPLLASAVNMMLTEGTNRYSVVRLNYLLDFYGSFCNPYSEKDRAGIVIYFLSRHIEKMLEISGEMLFYPLFRTKELSALMNKRLRWFLINREKVQTLASDTFFEAIFGKVHPYGRQILQEDFNNLDSQLLKDFHSRYYTANNFAIIVSGKIPAHTMQLLNKYMGGPLAEEGMQHTRPGLPNGVKERRISVTKSAAVQTAVRIGSATINRTHPDYPGLKILDTILGGYFGSRLMRNIREDKGLTYGISSSVTSLNLCGFKVISAEVSKKSTRFAIDEIYNEIIKLQNFPVGAEELLTVKNYMLGEMIRMFDGPFAIADSFRSAWEAGLDIKYYYRLAEKIKTITPDEITDLAKTYYNIGDLYEITAG